MNEWFLQPSLRGTYPEAHPNGLPLDAMGVKDGDFERMQGAARLRRHQPLHAHDRRGDARRRRSALARRAAGRRHRAATPGPKTDFGWEVWPNALHDILLRITRDYDRPIIEITENGCSYARRSRRERRRARHAPHRVLRRLPRRRAPRDRRRAPTCAAITPGRCSTTSSGREGYEQRFGIVWVDFATGKRILKESGRWYGNVAQQNALPG